MFNSRRPKASVSWLIISDNPHITDAPHLDICNSQVIFVCFSRQVEADCGVVAPLSLLAWCSANKRHWRQDWRLVACAESIG